MKEDLILATCLDASAWSAWFLCLQVELQAAVVGAFITLIVGVGGFVSVFLQIGAQARRTLFVEIYKDVLDYNNKATEAYSELNKKLWTIHADFTWQTIAPGSSRKPAKPRVTRKEILELKHLATGAIIDVMGVVERWRIVDPRLQIFLTALGMDIREYDEAWHEFNDSALSLLPAADEQDWELPEGIFLERYKTAQARVQVKGIDLVAHLIDFQNEMQFLLLGGLFKNSPFRRQTLHPDAIILRLDKFTELDKLYKDKIAKITGSAIHT